MNYPKRIVVNEKEYLINTDFKVALKCLEIINDGKISDAERTYAVIYLLFDIVPNVEDMEEFLRLTRVYLQCGEETKTHEERKKDMDFKHDKSYISASFMSDYQIDLSKVDMHWWQFMELLQGLTEETMLSRIREVRNFDLNDLKDAKARGKMVKAKEQLALPVELSEEEQEAISEFEKLFGGG